MGGGQARLQERKPVNPGQGQTWSLTPAKSPTNQYTFGNMWVNLRRLGCLERLTGLVLPCLPKISTLELTAATSTSCSMICSS